MGPRERDQTAAFEDESVRYFQMDLAPVRVETAYITTHPVLAAEPPLRILDVGCGPGYVLESVLDSFPGSTGVGVEPSLESVRLLHERHAPDPRFDFVSASAHALPLPTDAFDLVICWSVLHWLGRNEYLQALGELIRVCGRHLLVMDFCAQHDYRVTYRHDQRYFTYKADFTVPILASGIMSLDDDQRWVIDDTGARRPIDAAALEPFLRNPNSYLARRACLFRKQYSLLPKHEESDFESSSEDGISPYADR